MVDVSPEALIFEITGSEDKIESLVDVLRPFGIGDGPDGSRRDGPGHGDSIGIGVRPARGARGARVPKRHASTSEGDKMAHLLRQRRRPRHHPEEESGRHRLRLAGPRPCAEPEGQRRRRPGRPSPGEPEPEPGGSGRPHRRLRRRRRPLGGRHHGPRAGHRSSRDLRERDRPRPGPGQDADVRPRLLHPLQDGDPARERRRFHDRSEGSGTPSPGDLCRGRRELRRSSRSTRTIGQGERAGALLREGDRRHPRGRPADDVAEETETDCSESRRCSAAA